MRNIENNKAYNKGFKSELYDNPYAIGSDEYNDCERGWAQRVKRGYRCVTKAPKKKHRTFQEIYSNR
jgi:hypothetical protein